MEIRSLSSVTVNTKLAGALKKVPAFKKPEWINFVKSGSHKQRPIDDTDFWYKRAASILRQLSIHTILGVRRLRTRYGGRKDRGMKPAHFKKSGGKIIRLILQQAENAGFVEKVKSKRTGRQLTQKGKEFMESVAK